MAILGKHSFFLRNGYWIDREVVVRLNKEASLISITNDMLVWLSEKSYDNFEFYDEFFYLSLKFLTIFRQSWARKHWQSIKLKCMPIIYLDISLWSPNDTYQKI